jgi:hypothetical protein
MDAFVDRRRSTAAWAAVGGLWALAVLGLASIGWYVVPVVLLVTALVARHEGQVGLFGFAAGACALAVALLATAVLTG